MSIVSALLFILLISSGSVFCASYFNKRYEEILPITCASIVVVSFLLGLFGLLEISTTIICIISLVLYILSVNKSIKDKNIKLLINNIFTPGFTIFIVLVVFIIIGVYNKVFDSCDEFSHWGDVVKVMTILNDFGTNPESHSLFKSYPPAMSLFQYILQKINSFLTNESFSEWLCYFAYDVLAISFLLPITKKISQKKVLSSISILLCILLVPFAFYAYSYFSVYIDEFLAFLIAAGALNLLCQEKRDIWCDTRMCLIVIMLVISKDAGLLFAIFFTIAYVVEHNIQLNKKVFDKKSVFSNIICILSLLIPKLLWNLNIKINKVNVSFNKKVDIINLFNVLIGRDNSYRRKVFKNYVTELITGSYEIGKSGIVINYFCLTIFSILVVYFVSKLLLKMKKTNYSNMIVTVVCMIFITIVYIFGLCVIYMYKFTEDEALGLASFERYLHIIFLGIWLFVALCFIIYLDSKKDNSRFALCLVMFLFLYSTDLEALINFISNTYAKASLVKRSEYDEIVELTLRNADGKSKIWFIEQETPGEEGLQYNFCIRPNYISGDPSIKVNLSDDDYYSIEISAEEWKKELLNKDFDYVLLYQLDDNFEDDYKSLFDNPNDIDEKRLFKVDKDTGMLFLCE